MIWTREAKVSHELVGNLVARVVDAEGIDRNSGEWIERFAEVLSEEEGRAEASVTK